MTSGACLCGAVRFELTGAPIAFSMCHCSKCRRVSGVASNATLFTPRDRFRWLAGEDRITRFSLPGGWGVCRCATCGSPVPAEHPSGGAYAVPAGLVDSDPGVRVTGHIWVGSKAPWDEIAGDAPQLVEGLVSERVR